MKRSGYADLPLHSGSIPPWLAERMAALGGAAIGTAAGGIAGGLIGLGFSEYEAKEYESHLGDGRALISVHVASSEEADRAKKIMHDAGAKHISVKDVIHSPP
jgi:uncharacterized membrane protein